MTETRTFGDDGHGFGHDGAGLRTPSDTHSSGATGTSLLAPSASSSAQIS